jgi:hypothetical protein
MTIKKCLSVICLIFGIIPLHIVYWLGGTLGLKAISAFSACRCFGIYFLHTVRVI